MQRCHLQQPLTPLTPLALLFPTTLAFYLSYLAIHAFTVVARASLVFAAAAAQHETWRQECSDAAAATRRYAFLAEREKEELKASRAYLKTKRGRRDAAARGDYERRVSKQRQREHDERRRAVTARFRREERSKVKKTGKAPYYAKRSVLKGAVAQDRFADLKNRGKLGAFLAKRGRRAGLLEKGARRQGGDPTR